MAQIFGAGHSGNQDDIGHRISRQNIAARRRTIQVRHIIIHQDHIRPMAVIRLNCFEARADNFNDLVIEVGNESGKGAADISLVVGYQHSHEHFCRTFHATAPIIRRDFL